MADEEALKAAEAISEESVDEYTIGYTHIMRYLYCKNRFMQCTTQPYLIDSNNNKNHWRIVLECFTIVNVSVVKNYWTAISHA